MRVGKATENSSRTKVSPVQEFMTYVMISRSCETQKNFNINFNLKKLPIYYAVLLWNQGEHVMKCHLGRKRHFNTWLTLLVVPSFSFSYESLIISSYPLKVLPNFFREKMKWLRIISRILSLKEVRLGDRISVS